MRRSVERVLVGASSYVLKQIRGAELVDAVGAVGRGESLLDSVVTGRLLARLRNPPAEDARLAISPQEGDRTQVRRARRSNVAARCSGTATATASSQVGSGLGRPSK